LLLQLLEACVKNCVPFFFQQLIYSDLWGEIIKAGEPFRNVSEIMQRDTPAGVVVVVILQCIFAVILLPYSFVCCTTASFEEGIGESPADF
jgi:hypothetical protein